MISLIPPLNFNGCTTVSQTKIISACITSPRTDHLLTQCLVEAVSKGISRCQPELVEGDSASQIRFRQAQPDIYLTYTRLLRQPHR